MADPRFYQRSGPFRLDDLAAQVAFEAPKNDIKLSDIAPLDNADASELGFFANPKMAEQLAATQAGAVLVKAEHASLCPDETLALICDDPYRAMAQISQLFYPLAARARHMPGGMQDGHNVHPSAKIGKDVVIAQNAIIGPDAEIGDRSYIGAGAVIGHGVVMGRDCTIGTNAVVGYALIGDRVIIHSGAAIGVDGFGYAAGESHVKIPQLGRVILQADVEIGANGGIDRGALGDTIIGEGSKLDNLVHIAHNVQLGRHCFLTALCAVAGSSTLGDYVQMGGQSAVGGHISVGNRCVIAANASVLSSFPDDTEVAGIPARPRSEHYRDLAFLSRLRKRDKNTGKS